MNNYKMILIVESGAAGKTQIEKVYELIKEFKGKPAKPEFIGKKQFSYPIKKHLQGDYYQLIFSMSPTTTNSLKKEMRQKELVWRFLITNQKS